MRGIEAAFWAVLGKDLELKQGKTGKPFCNFSFVVTTGQDESQWVNVICFGETAEKLSKTAQKGDKVYCEGTLSLTQWNDAHGEVKHGLNVSAWRVDRLGNIGKAKAWEPRPEVSAAPKDAQLPLGTSPETPPKNLEEARSLLAPVENDLPKEPAAPLETSKEPAKTENASSEIDPKFNDEMPF